ncbi:MAG: 3-oxoacyl-[acyl-carrier-protein] synthase-3 [Candidatus Paceibacteria bacterium]|jgi:3-oxoacyl-[acyl-carrier-protein] synthase-3
MNDSQSVGIVGTGHYVPEQVITNAYFEKILDTSDEWIQQRTGIAERRFASDGEATSDFCIKASKLALEQAGISPEEVDLIVVGTISPDQYLPAVAPQVQTAIGACNAAAFDVAAACTGFITALSVGESTIRAGRAKVALVLGAETLSRFLDMQDRTASILFGDGAGAAVIKLQDKGAPGEILRISLGSDGAGYEYIQMVGGGSRRPLSEETLKNRENFITVMGREVYRFAVTTMTRTVGEMLEGYDADELGLLVPHQVNQRIIDASIDKLGISADKVMVNISKYGNTSAGSVPIALSEAVLENRIERGKLLVMCAFGAGLNWGGALVRW